MSLLLHVKRNGNGRPLSPDSFELGDVIKKNNTYWVINQSDGIKYWDIHPRYKYPNYSEYFILDNGGHPFCVYVENDSKELESENKIFDTIDHLPYPTDPLKLISRYAATKTIHIYKLNMHNYHACVDEHEIDSEFCHGIYVKTYNCIKEFIGKSYSGEGWSDYCIKDNNGSPILMGFGNTILLQIGLTKYVYIGLHIMEFTIDDQILEYYSMIGPSGTPRAIAVGIKNVYMMESYNYLPKSEFSPDTNWMIACLLPEWYKKKNQGDRIINRQEIHPRVF